MSARENQAIRELTATLAELITKHEVLTERVKILEKLIFGVIGLILTAVVTAITRGVIL